MKLFVGIDFGTTNSVISYFYKNKINVLKINNTTQIPTQIDKNNKLCGFDAKHNLIKNFKTNISEETKEYFIIYIKYLCDLIKTNLLSDDIYGVISIPTCFNHYQRDIIKNIFNKFIKVVRIINEPTSAALYYGIGFTEGLILVIDIGGGTTDFTLLEKDGSFYEVIDSYGDNNLGGSNFTSIIKDNLDISFNQAENYKKLLNLNNEIKYKNKILTKENYKILCNELIKKFNKLLDYFKKYNNNIDKIICVGGCHNLYLIKEIIEERYKDSILCNDLQTIVSKGNCYYNCYLNNLLSKEIVVLERTNLNIGIETADKNLSILIKKNDILPTKCKRKYRIEKIEDNTIDIYQGESLVAKNNSKIGQIKLPKLDLYDIISIEFILDIENILNIIIEKDNKKIYSSILKFNNKELIEDKIDIDDYQKNSLLYYIRDKINLLINQYNYNNLINNKIKEDKINNLLIIYESLEKKKNIELLKIKEDLDINYVIENKIKEDLEVINVCDKSVIESKIEEIIDNYKLEEEDINYLKNILEIVENTEDQDVIDINLINLEEKFSLDSKEEYLLLVDYIRDNIEDLDYSENNKKKIKKYIENLDVRCGYRYMIEEIKKYLVKLKSQD